MVRVELGWERGQDDEELFEFAMHEKQYREYKSGQAKEQFNKDLAERIQKAAQGTAGNAVKVDLQEILRAKREQMFPDAQAITASVGGRVIWELDYNETSLPPMNGKRYLQGQQLVALQTAHGIESIVAPYNLEVVATEKQQGAVVAKGDVLCYVEPIDIVEEATNTIKEGLKAAKKVIKEAAKEIKEAAKELDKEEKKAPFEAPKDSKWKFTKPAKK